MFRLIFLLLACISGLAALTFASLWFSAVPRLECNYEADFCSDYGSLYAAFALGCAGIASGLLFAAIRMAR